MAYGGSPQLYCSALSCVNQKAVSKGRITYQQRRRFSFEEESGFFSVNRSLMNTLPFGGAVFAFIDRDFTGELPLDCGFTGESVPLVLLFVSVPPRQLC